MKVTSDQENLGRHPELLLLGFAENSLDAEERSSVQRHLDQCETCAGAVELCSQIISQLRANQEVFCPHSAELYDWVRGHKPEGLISDHVRICADCAKEIEVYAPERLDEQMPVTLWNKIRGALPAADPEIKNVEHSPGFWEKLSELFRFRTLAVSGAVALLLFFTLYPYNIDKPYIVGLSSEQWESALKPKSVRPKAALVVMQAPGRSIEQGELDAIYRSLQPGLDITEKIDVIPPATFAEAVKSKKVDAYNRERLLKDIYNELNASTAMLVTIDKLDNRTNAIVEKVNTQTGKTIDKNAVENLDQHSFIKLQQVVKNLLLSDQ